MGIMRWKVFFARRFVSSHMGNMRIMRGIMGIMRR